MRVRASVMADGVMAATGLIGLLMAVRYLRARAVHPDLPDPAAALLARMKITCIAVAIAVAVVNLAAVTLIPSDYLLITLILLVLADAAVVYFGAQWLLVFLFKAYAQRRKSKYVICELDYRGAPRASKTTMRQIYRSDRRLTGSHALQSGVLGEVEVGRLVYSAAEHAVAAADVNHSLRQLKPAADAEDRSAIEDAESALADLPQYLAEVEQALKNAAGTAEATRTEASNPPVFRGRQGPLPYAEEAARHDVRAKVSESVAASRTKIKVDTAEFTDQVSAMSYGYQESQRISRNALHGPDLTPDPAAPTPPASAASSDSANATGSPSVTRKLAKSAGRTAGRAAAKGALIAGDASLAGAKFAVAKVKARVAQKDRDTGGAHQ